MFPTLIKIVNAPRFESLGGGDDSSSGILKKQESSVEAASTVVNSTASATGESASLVSSISDNELAPCFRVKAWDKKSRYSDMIRDGLVYVGKSDTLKDTVTLFQSPSSSNPDSAFYNSQAYRIHDYPPSCSVYKGVLGPCRYAAMNGTQFPTFLEAGAPPPGLLEHWEAHIPGFERPQFISEIPENAQVYAYLPCESIANHMNDPFVHWHLVGKDALHLMTDKTTKLLPNTKVQRPCVVKTTHSMASKGIFVINNDEDEAEFEAWLEESGNPSFIVTEFVDIARNVACHFFIHPNGSVVWLGSNENYKDAEGKWSMDSYQYLSDAKQEELKQMQLPFVQDVAQYCQSLGFWGFCGADVLFDYTGTGYLVDVNPRVTGSCPSLMTGQLMKDKYGYEFGLFRRNGNITFYGPLEELIQKVETFNEENEGQCKIVLFSACQESETSNYGKMNIGVYSHSLDKCKEVVGQFCAAAQPQA